MNSEFSKFVILEKLGEGQYGKVYKAKYLLNNQLYALKEIQLIDPNDTGMQQKDIEK